MLSSKPLLSSEIADILGIDRSSVSRILAEMTGKKLISSTSGKSRTVSYSITDIGQSILDQIRAKETSSRHLTYELYGVEKHNVDSLLSKNILTVYLPVAAAIYMSDCNIPVATLSVRNQKLQLGYVKFESTLGIDKSRLREIDWRSQEKNPNFTRSRKPPGNDMIPFLDGRPLIELEIKLTVVPTFYEEKVTEMIVRQNTQFNFAERLSYYYGKYLPKQVTIEDLKKLLNEHSDEQRPFILQGVWKTQGNSAVFDKTNTLDVLVITDFAYLKMLLDSNLSKSSKVGRELATRIGRVLNHLIKWINEFMQKGTITYKEEEEGSKDHLKITLYIVDHLEDLRDFLLRPRLKFSDLMAILPLASVQKLSPERRLDQSIVHTLLQEGILVKRS